MTLKLSIITDIHYGASRRTRCGQEAIRLFGDFLAYLDHENPDYVIDLGDRILDVDHPQDIALMTEMATHLKKIKQPRAHLLGNHDVETLSVEDNERILEAKLDSWSVDVNGFHLVFWNTNTKLRMDDHTVLDPSHLEWLKSDLSATALPAIVFTHFPLDSANMIGHYYFQGQYAHHTGYSEEQNAQIRAIMEESEKVILCVNGHTHGNAYKVIDGIHYVTIPSLTEAFPTYPDPNEAWAGITVDHEKIEIQVYGRTPNFYRLPVKKLKQHWAHGTKPYAPNLQET